MADADTTTTGEAGTIPADAGRAADARRPKRWPVVLAVVGAVLVAVWFGLGFWNVNYYAITPGNATAVAPLITVPASLDRPLTGSILLTDVYVTPLTAQSYLVQRFLSSDSQVLPSGAVLDPLTPADQFTDQGYLDMNQAQSYATAAALTHLGYSVSAHNAGTLVYGTVTGSPAAASLRGGAGHHRGQREGHPDPMRAGQFVARRGARYPGHAQRRAVDHQPVRHGRPGPDRVQAGDPDQAATGIGRDRLQRQAHRTHRLPGAFVADPAGLDLPRQGHGAHGRHRRTIGRALYDAWASSTSSPGAT